MQGRADNLHDKDPIDIFTWIVRRYVIGGRVIHTLKA